MYKIIDFIKRNSYVILIVIASLCMLLYIRNDRTLKTDLLRNLYKEEFDSFDIEKHKEYIESGSYDSIPEDANLKDFKPTKTSELVTNCDEKRQECIEY